MRWESHLFCYIFYIRGNGNTVTITIFYHLKTAEDVVLSAKVDLIRYIVAVKLAEAEERQQAALKKQKKDKLLAILAEKQDQSLMNKSEKELQKMLDELED